MKLKTLFLPIIALLLLASACGNEAAQLRDHGHETGATLMSKSTVKGTSRRSSSSYTFELAFFAQSAAEIEQATHQDDVLKDTSMTMSERLDHWHPGGAGIGDYTTVKISVGQEAWDKYKQMDRVQIVYLPEDPTVVRLKEEL